MQPIPRGLLIHSATLSAITLDRWQIETPTIIADLSNVRVEPSSKVVLTKDNTEKQLTALLLYDCRNSRPVNVNFTEGQKVEALGKEYHVSTIEKLYDGRHLHHLEVGLA